MLNRGNPGQRATAALWTSRRRIAPLLAACVLAVALAALLASCFDQNDSLPPGARPFTPLAVYSRWWGLTESCSGRVGNVATIEWFVVPGVATFAYRGGVYSGYWIAGARDRIVMAERAMRDGQLVRHEMLHALIRSGDHPRTEFLGACAGTVACVGQCLADAGTLPLPPNNTPVVPPESIEVSIEVDPATPAVSTSDGFLTLLVLARNPATDPVIVALPPSTDSAPSHTFGFTLTGQGISASGDERETDSSVALFAPGEVKRYLFDLPLGTSQGAGLVAGAYTMRAAYGQRWTDATVLDVAP